MIGLNMINGWQRVRKENEDPLADHLNESPLKAGIVYPAVGIGAMMVILLGSMAIIDVLL